MNYAEIYRRYSRRLSAHDRVVYDIYDDIVSVLIVQVEGHYLVLIITIHRHSNMMKTYLEYIKEKILNKEGTPEQRFIYLRCLVTFFHNEIVYLAYKYVQEQSIDILHETQQLKKAYCFNDIAWNAYNWSNSELSKGWLDDLYKSKQLPSKEDMEFAWYYPDMQDYAFYDGTPVKEVIEELDTLKGQHKR